MITWELLEIFTKSNAKAKSWFAGIFTDHKKLIIIKLYSYDVLTKS
jgi:hypothetical protein